MYARKANAAVKVASMGINRVKDRKTTEYIKLVMTPAIEIFIMSFAFLICPPIIMTPGAIILKGKNTESRVKTEPHVVRRNSAHKPAF